MTFMLTNTAPAIPPTVWGLLIAAATACAVAAISSVSTYFNTKQGINGAKAQREEARKEQAEQATAATLAARLYREEQSAQAALVAAGASKASTTAALMGRKLDAIHTLVNSSTGVLLKERVIDTKRIADFSGTPQDIQRWQEAVEASLLHEKQQAVLDALTQQQAVHDAEKHTP